MRKYSYILPLALLCSGVFVEHFFDNVFFLDHARRQAILVDNLVWADPLAGNAAAFKDFTARLIAEVADVALVIAGLWATFICGRYVWKAWQPVDLERRCVIVLAGAASGIVILICFYFYNPLGGSLAFLLTAKAAQVADRPILGLWQLEFSVVIVALWANAICAGVILAKDIDQHSQRDEELKELTMLLYSSAALVVAFMFRIGGTFLWASALLRVDSDREMVRQLALAMAVNYGIFFAILLGTIHFSAVYIATKKTCADPQLDAEKPTLRRHVVELATVLSPVLAGIPITKILDTMFS